MTVTKPGKHGTLSLFAVEYTGGEGCPVFRDHRWAYSREHIEQRIAEEFTAEGWTVLRFTRMTEGPEHRWRWVDCTKGT